MASTPHEAAEDEALDLLAASLTNAGFTTCITARPDRDDAHELTVDALLDVEGVKWAVDHTLLTWGSGAPPQAQRLVSYLQGEIEKRARRAGKFIRVLVSAQPNDADPDTVSSEVLGDVDNALKSGAALSGTMHTVQVGDHSSGSAEMCEVLIAQGSDPRDFGSIAAAENQPVIESKLEGQLRLARARGLRTGLLIDQFHNHIVPTGTNWFISEHGIAGIVEDSVAATHEHLSACWVLDKDGAIALVFGAVEGTEIPG